MVVPRRHELTDEEWALLEPLLPRSGARRPYHEHRRILNGILFVLHTGVPCRDLPERYGPWQTVYSRLRRWTTQGLWERLLSQLQARLAEEDRIAWTLWCIDGSVVRAHKHAAGARRGGKNSPGAGGLPEPADHALGRSRGGFGTKVHLVTDGRGLPLALHLTGGQRQECEVLEPLLQAGGHGSAQPCWRATRRYSFPRLRRWLRARHVRAVIPERQDQRERREHRPGRRPTFDQAAYRERNVIERAVGWLKEPRRVATRYKKLAIQYLAMLYVSLLEKYLRTLFADTA
jgi:transposase